MSKLNEAEHTTIELQEAITDKLRTILGEEGVEILTEYVWHMLVNPKRSHHHLVQELQEFLAEETDEFVNWILAHVAPQVDSKVLSVTLANYKDNSQHKEKSQHQHENSQQFNQQYNDSNIVPKGPERKYRVERRERMLGLAVHQATHQDPLPRFIENARLNRQEMDRNSQQIHPHMQEEAMEDDRNLSQYHPSHDRRVNQSQQMERATSRYRSRSPIRKRSVVSVPNPHSHSAAGADHVYRDRAAPADNRNFIKRPGQFLGIEGQQMPLMRRMMPFQPALASSMRTPMYPGPRPVSVMPPMLTTNRHPHHFSMNPPAIAPLYAYGGANMVQMSPKTIPFSVIQEAASAQGFVLKPASASNSASSGKKTIKKRCPNWPDCSAGEACSYVHPAEMCNFWPHCTYGSTCLYIHPQLPCKFGLNCHNTNCNYIHPEKWDPSTNMARRSMYSVYYKNKSLNASEAQATQTNDDLNQLSETLPNTPPMTDEQSSVSENAAPNEPSSN